MIVVHVTHEAVEKVGGIGAVIDGLVTTDAYARNVSRTVLLGPLFQTDRPASQRLGQSGKIIYSSLDGITPPEYREKFHPIERTYDVGIIYGTRQLRDPIGGRTVEVEVVLVDVFHCNRDRLNLFKYELHKKFAVPSDRFENIWEFEEYIRLAEPGYEALKALGCNGGGPEKVVYLAHEYMGMPTALKAILAGSANTRTVFYAHEVASVRPIVETRPGHDTMFYNVLRTAGEHSRTLEELFPEVFGNYKHALVKAARYLDHVFAVGDLVEDELRFIDPHFRTMDLDLVYNGIPVIPLSLEQKKASRNLLAQYAQNLFGVRPNWVFTHVARPVVSKAMWRDLAVMHEMEEQLAARGETAVYFMLGTLAGQRRPQDVRHMERVYGWPVHHEAGYPDLCGGEEVLGTMFADFNRHHQHARVVLVNQWGWGRGECGERMPSEMKFADVRRGSDLEFGLSIYEPFGISQFEALSFGALCVVSNACGCMGFARKAAQNDLLHCNVIEGNFLHAEGSRPEDFMNMSPAHRDWVERQEAKRIAATVIECLPRDDKQLQERMKAGFELATKMSWECVVNDFFLPALNRTLTQS